MAASFTCARASPPLPAPRTPPRIAGTAQTIAARGSRCLSSDTTEQKAPPTEEHWWLRKQNLLRAGGRGGRECNRRQRPHPAAHRCPAWRWRACVAGDTRGLFPNVVIALFAKKENENFSPKSFVWELSCRLHLATNKQRRVHHGGGQGRHQSFCIGYCTYVLRF